MSAQQSTGTTRFSAAAPIPLGTGFYTEAGFYAGQLNFDSLIQKAEASGALIADPRFLMDNAYQAPPVARFGVKFIF